MLPSFLKFIEQQEDQSSVSSPQHELGEEGLNLNKVIEKRIKEIINEFQIKGKATEKDILASFDYNLKKMLGNSTSNQDGAANQQTANQQTANQQTAQTQIDQNQMQQNS